MFAMNPFRFLLPIAVCLTLGLSQGLSMDVRAQTMMPGSSTDAAVSIDLEDPVSKEAVREMVSRLSDGEVRSLLIQRLDAVAEAKEKEALENRGAFGVIREGFERYWENARQSILTLYQVPVVIVDTYTRIMQAAEPEGIGFWVLIVMAAIALGAVSERLVALFFRKQKQKLIDSFSTTLGGILKIIYTRLSLDVLGVLAFYVFSYFVVISVYSFDSLIALAADTILSTIVGAWMGYVVCRFFFAPKRPELRICKTSDERALRLTISFAVLAGFIVFIHNAFTVLIQIGILNAGGWEYMGPIAFLMNMSMYVSSVWVILYNRQALTEILVENKKRVSLAIGEEVPEDISWFAVHWPKIAVLLIIAKYLLVEIVVNSAGAGVYSTSAVYITFVVIFLWPGVDANVSLFVARGIKVPEDETEGAGKARRSMQQGLLRVGRVLVVGAVSYALALLWGVNLLGVAQAGLGVQAAGRLVELLLIGLFAYIVWELVSIIIGRWMALEGGHPDDHAQEDAGGGDIGGVGLSRVATLLPIIRKSSQFLIVVVSVIMVLDNWGVNIGPILAGAGVVGLAIGFGAQTLVKDIVSGLFFLADDAFRVGEYIDVGGTMGNVEKISLRSLRLRHHRGLVHTIPYGEIPKLSNFSRDWVIMKLRFRVPFDTDVNKVKKIFKTIGKELLDDPILGEDFLQPFKSQGVAEVDDNGIVVRGKFMAKPGKQFMIRKEVYVRVQKTFDEAGIPFARKQVMVHIPGLEKGGVLNDEDARAIGAAAAESVDEELDTDQGDKKEKPTP
ncbi:MAG: mechanosensitive ion channel [Gammaproteobacteria bacterium]|nr:mechanosensitive ion channel [Gammaproteobacteria bacterium]